ncbi:aminotransferase class III-fold pyridoxal phosphate-dependent enzyme [Dasania marina]|uniref:aminotransferase class III-fold pyridoxal phosphate-dependent enzyme n=1 Tax=Dasania marina TaxID=471499 RepID=UPI0003734128|nr:aminotransferase class III-fold pyridoxal phosphate-dependent enzyme [Dasania marina]
MNELNSDNRILKRSTPSFSMDEVLAIAQKHFALSGVFKEVASERDQGFIVATESDEKFILKISNSQDDFGVIDFQTQVLRHVEQQAPNLPIPRVILSQSGACEEIIKGKNGEKHVVRLLTFLPGVMVRDRPELNSKALRRDVGATVAKLDKALRGFFHPHAKNVHPWDVMNFMVHRPHTDSISNADIRAKVETVFDYVNKTVTPKLTQLRHQVVHQDAHGGNVLLNPENPNCVAGLIDFGDMLYSPLIMELVVACSMMMEQVEDPVSNMCDIVVGYDRELALEEEEIDLLYDLILVRVCIYITLCAWRSAEHPEQEPYVKNIELYWALLDKLLNQGRHTVSSRFRTACRFPAYSPAIGEQESVNESAEQELLQQRHRLLGEQTWHFYQRPLHVERALGPWLYGVDGKAYLDLYNNVPQVGHCHPHVVRAISRQAKVLNTNTRYLYRSVLDYAERLTSLMPDHLNACIFFNSGSEANDIALQMSRLISGNDGAIVVEDAYHGISETIRDLSPKSRPQTANHIATLGVPCSYRGPHAGKENSAELYAQDADAAIAQLQSKGIKPACFMVDTAYCSSGVIDVPEGYLALVEQKVRAAGGLIVADEVQAGFGRLGQMWGHEARGLKADIVTMGKPVGNGHPLGVLVTSKAILNRFIEATAMFSTFGGNPVSCAAGMAVLDVIEDEDLINNANQTGDYLREQLRQLATSQPLIGDVRGQGMLASVEFVTDRVTKAPAREQTFALLELMREQGVLIGSSGPLRNSLKLRPSLVFSKPQVDIFIQALDSCLSQLGAA